MSISFTEYRQFDGLGLAELVKKKEVSSQELLEVAEKRMQSVQPKVNAFNFHLQPSKVEAEVKDAAFSGVPFVLKDLCLDTPNMPTSSGCQALKDYYPSQISNLVGRYLSAGFRPFAKSATPELGLMGVTEPDAFGACRNPWDLSRSPGGSSGGSAVAVSAGVVPIAAGGDGGGSLRIPAACTGLLGFKPSRGRVSSGPNAGEYWQGAVQEHVLTRSVRDSVAVFDLINGPASGDPFNIPKQSDFYKSLQDIQQSLNIGLCLKTPQSGKPDEETTLAMTQMAKQLEKLGHTVDLVEFPYDGAMLLDSYLSLYYAEVAQDLVEMGELIGRKLTKKDVEIGTWTLAHLGNQQSARKAIEHRRNWNQLARQMGLFHKKHDIYMSPVLTQKPPKIGSLKPSKAEERLLNMLDNIKLLNLVEWTGTFRKVAEKNFSVMPYTQIANLTGQPAMSVPAWFDNKLPIGVQFVAANGQDKLLFQLARQIEQALPWFDKNPAEV